MKQVSKNLIYNIIYQLFIFIIPLISTPYISRILGVNNIGIYAYTYSIISYFMLGAMIGINNHGTRTIAKNSNDKKQISKDFCSIYALQLMLTLVMIIIYIAFTQLVAYDYKNIMIIQTIFLISVALDINWFFFGLENFKITISKNIIIKVFTLILIFIFVKNKNDLWKYTLIMSSGTLISQAYLWIYIKKYIAFTKVKFKDILSHIKPCLILFVPVIAYSIYRIMDKTMIGFFSNTIELGNYESAEKIINIPISFITAFGTVMLPHMSKEKNNSSNFNNTLLKSFNLCLCFSIPMAFGLFMISNDITTIFFGNEFIKTSIIIKSLSTTIIFSSIANVIRTNYLIPNEKDNIYVKSTICGAIINLITNLILIPKYGAYGACVGTIFAEFFVMLYQILKTYKEINYHKILQFILSYSFNSIIMCISIIIINLIVKNIYIKIILQILLGFILYMIISIKQLKLEPKNNHNNNTLTTT